MGATDAARPQHRPPEWLAAISPEDQAGLDALVEQSNWNQLPDDWRLFAGQGRIAVIRDTGGRPLASGAILPMGHGAGEARIAWISLILVLPEARGHGLGRAIFSHCLRAVRQDGRLPLLDATPAGEPLYASLGFAPLWKLARWERPGAAPAPAATDARQVDASAIARLDAQAFGVARPATLAQLAGRAGSRCVDDAHGFAIMRPGRLARHVGPVVADTQQAGAALIRRLVEHTTDRIFIDVPDHQPELHEQLKQAGFIRQRDFTRMAGPVNGLALPTDQPTALMAIAGPEYG